MTDYSLRGKKVWEENWERTAANTFTLQKELALPDSLAWKRIIDELKSHFGSISGLRVIEIGAGMGRTSARLAKEGAEVSLIDFSPVVIKKAEDFFRASGLKANFLAADIFSLPEGFKGSFDLSISFGLVEHFKSSERKKVFLIHAQLLKKRGMALIGTPNSFGIPYRFWMALARLIGAWEVGYEKPYTVREIKRIMKTLDYSYRRWGTPIVETINTYLINKLNIVLTNLICFRRLRARGNRKKVYSFIPLLKERWSCLDDWLGYHLVFIYK